MSKIKLIIEIDENDYHRFVNGFANEDDSILIENLFKNGTPITDGDLISRSALKAKIENLRGYVGVGMSPSVMIRNKVIDLINNAPTIVEADKNETDS